MHVGESVLIKLLEQVSIPEDGLDIVTRGQAFEKATFLKRLCWGAFDSAKNHKRRRRKRQSVTAKREKSQTPKFV